MITKDSIIPEKPTHHMLLPGPEIPDLKMFIRARNAVWMSKRAIGIRGFRGLVATMFCNHLATLLQKIIASKKNQHIE
jgi:hypothetical protein